MDLSAPLSRDNAGIAAAFREVADLLDAQGANPFRVRAYRQAATTVAAMSEPVETILEQRGRKALVALSTIGEGLAAAIEEIVHHRRLRLLDRLKGETAPEDLFAAIPGIGEHLAGRIHETLEVDSLEELEIAAHDGRLDAVPGFGPDRLQAVREYLATALDRSTRRTSRQRRLARTDAGPAVVFDDALHPLPPVAELLAIDARYRALEAEDRLPKIAPRRFNPGNRRWLPVWHTDAAGFDLTVMFSNSARAHHLGQTRDWVVIFFERGGQEDQCTVVTEFRGELRGRRVVRGRENECAEHYRRETVSPVVVDWAHRQAESLEAQREHPALRRIRADVQQEIERLHRFFQDWFDGSVEDTKEGFEAAESVLAPGFVLVSPRGELHPRTVLLAQIRAAHGSRPGLKIWIEELQLVHASAEIAICTYREWQQARGESPRGRLSSAVLERRGRELRWLHVHETWLPAEPKRS